MIKRRIGAFALAAALCAGMMAGCSPKEESQIGEDGVLELEFYNADGEEDLWDNAVAEAITEATGVRLKIDYPVAAQDMKVALMIAEQNVPDILYA